MTHKQMREQVRDFLGLQGPDSGFDETPMIEDQLYQGTLDMMSRTRCVVRCIDLNVTAGVNQYLLDHSVLALVDIEDGLTKVNRDSTYQPSFTLIRSDVLRVQPTPAEDGSFQTWAVKRPSKMTVDGDSPGAEQFGAIPDEWHDAIVTYALWKLSDYDDDQSGAQGERYRVLYEGQDGRGGRLAQIRQAVNKRGTARAPRRRVRLAGVRSADNWTG